MHIEDSRSRHEIPSRRSFSRKRHVLQPDDLISDEFDVAADRSNLQHQIMTRANVSSGKEGAGNKRTHEETRTSALAREMDKINRCKRYLHK